MTKKKKYIPNLIKLFFYTDLILIGVLLGAWKKGFIDFSRIPFLEARVSASDTISAVELKKELEDKDFLLINVHTPYEGEIEKTDAFIEFDSLVASKDLLPDDKTAPIILYCQSGNMSAQALTTLKNMGYTNVRHLDGGMQSWSKKGNEILDLSKLPDEVLPKEGLELPISWENIGPELIKYGVIDLVKFEKVVKLTDDQRKILTEGSQEKIKIDAENSQYIVDMLWALGLAQKSKVYDEGPMGKEYKATAGNFASTGGWNLAKSKATDYLNKYDLIALSSDQQEKVAEISKNVFRPCCGNSTWFPDCNHGMAALAAIELMVANDIPDDEIYKNILKLNSFWFPQHYLTIATYFTRQGTPWGKVDAKLVLSGEYSSGQAAGRFTQEVGPLPYEGSKSRGGCGA
jgi:rhodanese-related sulfurtransferase